MTPLKKLFGKSVDLEKLPAELRTLLEEMRKERNAFEAVAVRSASSVQRAEVLAQPVAQAQQQVAELGQRLAAFDGIPQQLAEVASQLAAITAGQRAAEEQLVETRRIAQGARTELEELRVMLGEAVTLKPEVAGILEMGQRFKELDGQLRDVTTRFEQMRGQQQEILRGTADASSRLAAFEEQWRKVSGETEALAARAETFEQTAVELRQLATEMPNAKRELSTLKALADYVSQKVSTLEGQRDAVERATKGSERLADLVGQVDRQLQQQHTNTKFLSKLEENVHELKQLHETFLEQTEEVQKRQRAIETADRAQREAFTSLQQEVKTAASRFAFERDGLAAINQRVVELREALGAVEQRLPGLESARGAIESTESTAERLAARVRSLAEELAAVEAEAATLQGVGAEVQALQQRLKAATEEGDRASRLLKELEERSKQFDAGRTRLARFETKLGELLGAEEQVERSLTLAKERQVAVDAMRTDLQRLFEIADATVEHARQAVSLQREIDQRRTALDEVIATLREIDRQGEGLEERKRQLQEAEQHLARLDALLINLKSTLQTVLDQKEFLDKVVETAGTLVFQTMQAEAVISTLRQEREAAEEK